MKLPLLTYYLKNDNVYNNHFKSNFWKACDVTSYFKNISDMIDQLPAFAFSKQDMRAAAHQAEKNIHHDLARLEKNAAVLFPQQAADTSGAAMADLFHAWRADPVSIQSLAVFAARKSGLDMADKKMTALLLVACAADVPNNNPFHGNHHFREVTASMARLCAVSGTLTKDEIFDCLIAAAAHDLDHDGKGNGPVQWRLEQKAIDAAKVLMTAAGMGETEQARIDAMIRVTDVSGNPSPHHIMQDLARGKDTAVPVEMAALKADKKLLQMAAMMSDADLTPSSGTTRPFNDIVSGLLQQENPMIVPGHANLRFFFNVIMGGGFSSDVGKSLSQKDFNNVLKTAEEPVKHPAPK